jgi:hypothetical protein
MHMYMDMCMYMYMCMYMDMWLDTRGARELGITLLGR